MQEARVWSLVQEDPMCNGATKPMGHNYWACALEPGSRIYRVLSPHVLEPVSIQPESSPHLPWLERSLSTAVKTQPSQVNKQKTAHDWTALLYVRMLL